LGRLIWIVFIVSSLPGTTLTAASLLLVFWRLLLLPMVVPVDREESTAFREETPH
jgi:hypothetical protein